MSDGIKTILCYGDSNTHGTCPMAHIDDVRRFGRHERWPGRMASVLGRDYHVIEEGHPGRTTAHPDPLEGAHKNGQAVLPAILGGIASAATILFRPRELVRAIRRRPWLPVLVAALGAGGWWLVAWVVSI